MYTYLFEVDVLKKYRGITRLSTLVDKGEEGVKIWPKTVVEWTDPMQNFHLKAVQNAKFLDAS